MNAQLMVYIKHKNRVLSDPTPMVQKTFFEQVKKNLVREIFQNLVCEKLKIRLIQRVLGLFSSFRYCTDQ